MRSIPPTLVSIDLDGTLLDDKKNISVPTKEYLQHLSFLGIHICLASGRPYRAMTRYIEQLQLNSLIVSGNGALIVDPFSQDKILSKVTYPAESILKCIQAIDYEAFDLIMVEDGNKLFLNREKTEKDDFIWTKDMEVIIGNHFEEAVSPDGAIFKLKYEKDKYKLISLSHKDPLIGIRFWGDSLIGELFFKNINKATAIKKIADYYGVGMDNTISFGDDVNDLEMIIQAEVGVSMNNGSEILKKYSDMSSIDDNNHDGVMQTLKLLLHGI